MTMFPTALPWDLRGVGPLSSSSRLLTFLFYFNLLGTEIEGCGDVLGVKHLSHKRTRVWIPRTHIGQVSIVVDICNSSASAVRWEAAPGDLP